MNAIETCATSFGWASEWSDLVDFEILPVVEGKDTAAALSG
jgi:hypothetical protein